MVPYLIESKHRPFGYVDVRTVLRTQCLYAGVITTSELSRVGFPYQVRFGFNYVAHGEEIDDMLSRFFATCSGRRWTAANTSSQKLDIVFAFADANDAMLMRLIVA